MTKQIFNDIENEADLDNTELKPVESEKSEKEPLTYSFNLAKIPTMTKINLVKNIGRQIFLGLAVPKILDMYYNFENYELSPIFNVTGKDKDYLERYFLLLITTVGWSKDEEFLYWLSFINDEQGIPLSLHAEATEPSNFVEAQQYLLAVARFFTAIMLDDVAIEKIADPILAGYAEKELTLANYLYLSYYRKTTADSNNKSQE